MITSHSEVETALLCSRRHYYAFGEKLARKSTSISLSRGVAGHAVLAAFFDSYKANRSYSVAYAAAMNHLAELMQEAKSADDVSMLGHLTQIVSTFLENNKERIANWQIESVEQEYRVELEDDLTYAFTIDLVARERGQLIVVDWKFAYDFYEPKIVKVLPQVPKYIGGLQRMGMQARRGYYGILRTRSLKSPTPDSTFRLVPIEPNPARVARTFHEFTTKARELHQLKQLPLAEWEAKTTRTGNNIVCKGCSFAEICGIELEGRDASLDKKMDYEVNTYGYGNDET